MVGTAAAERSVEAGLIPLVVGATAGTDVAVAVFSTGEFPLEAAVVEPGGMAELLVTTEAGADAASEVAVTFEGPETALVPTTGDTPELSVGDGGTTEVEMEKPTEVKVAVVVGEANKTVLEETSLTAVGTEGVAPGIEDTKLVSVGTFGPVTELLDKGIGMNVELSTVGVDGGARAEVAGL